MKKINFKKVRLPKLTKKTIGKGILSLGLATAICLIGIDMQVENSNLEKEKVKLEQSIEELSNESGELAKELNEVKNDKIQVEQEKEQVVKQVEETKAELDSVAKQLNDVKYERNELKKEYTNLQASRSNSQRKTSSQSVGVSEKKANNTTQMSSTSSSNVGGWMTFNASAYSTQANGDPYAGDWGNKTALGTSVRAGVIAVDRNVIPLGSKVEIKFPSGWEYLNGIYTAEDVGGAIKGSRIDVFMNNYNTCLSFGRRNVQLRVTQ